MHLKINDPFSYSKYYTERLTSDLQEHRAHPTHSTPQGILEKYVNSDLSWIIRIVVHYPAF